MSTLIQHGHHDHGVAQFLKSTGLSIFALAPSLVTGLYLIDHRQEPFYSATQIVCVILLLATISLVTVVIIDAHRQYFSRFTQPALISMISLVILFVVAESMNRFVEHVGYGFLTPLVIAAIGFIYGAVIFERNIIMKAFLSLNTVGVMFLWALGSVDKFSMPF